MRVLVCGSRTWKDRAAIRKALAKYPDDTELIHGAGAGADFLADEVARERGWKVCAYPVDWEKHGRSAGPIRNRAMLTEGQPDIVLAFREVGKSPGTDNMVDTARRAGVEVSVYYSDNMAFLSRP